MRILFACLLALTAFSSVTAQTLKEKSLSLDATLDHSTSSLYLTWQDAKRIRVGPIDINRRILGEMGAQTWRPIVTDLDPVIGYRDDTLKPGTAYEYQVIRKAKNIVDVGYWTTGVELPAVETRGTALVVVDDTIAQPLADHLDRFEFDLIGDGWTVIRTTWARHDADPEQNLKSARALRAWVTKNTVSSPQTPHNLILIGHVPIVQSGRIAPDGHKPIPHATDQFYADTNSKWPEGLIGKLRPSIIPDFQIELTVGRIDFEPVAKNLPDKELRLLKAYFDKNHHWRHGFLGDLRDAYAQNDHLIVEQDALRNVVGPDAITEGGHHDVGEEKPWLWGVDFGDRQGKNYGNKYANKAIFAINFGSHKQKFDRRNNQLVGLLAMPWYTVAVGWGGRPAWRLNHMALGGTIGEVLLRTVNNGTTHGAYREVMDYFPTGRYLWRSPIWANLMGDPTLRAFPLPSLRNLRAEQTAAGTRLSWSASEQDVLGYRIYHATSATGPYEALADGRLLDTPEFTDATPIAGAHYMVRAYGLRKVYAGSFFSYSQGAFTTLDAPLVDTSDTAIQTKRNTPVRISPSLGGSKDATLSAFIEGPQQGSLTQDDQGWLFVPPTDFTGDVPLRVSKSSPFETHETQLVISVIP
ncbi:MAG: hypothetical protein ABJL99_13615 [Aliishimia sp.]